MTNYYSISATTKLLPGIVQRAYRNDLIEMQLTMAVSAGLLFPMPGMAAAMSAAPRIAMAVGQSNAAVAQITQVVDGWLARSANSLQLLDQNRQRWTGLQERAAAIGEDMRRILERSDANFWAGVAHEAKREVHEQQIAAQEGYSKAMSLVPAALGNAKSITTLLFGMFSTRISPVVASTSALAGRFPFPNPAGFGICTRTTQVAAALTTLAAELRQLQAGGMWRLQERVNSTIMTVASTTMQESRRGNRP